jgi:anti-sigma B factor antagonist
MLRISEHNSVKIFTIEAKIVDSDVASALRATIMEIVPQNRHFVIDFSGTHLVDSGGLAGIVMLHKFLLGQDCHMSMCGLNKSVLGLFKLTRMDRLFDLQESLACSINRLELKN